MNEQSVTSAPSRKGERLTYEDKVIVCGLIRKMPKSTANEVVAAALTQGVEVSGATVYAYRKNPPVILEIGTAVEPPRDPREVIQAIENMYGKYSWKVLIVLSEELTDVLVAYKAYEEAL